MPDAFDLYRESLVMETTTIWPDEFDVVDSADRGQIAAALHEDPESCQHIDYVRVHTGFCRQITVTQEDYDRVTV